MRRLALTKAKLGALTTITLRRSCLSDYDPSAAFGGHFSSRPQAASFLCLGARCFSTRPTGRRFLLLANFHGRTSLRGRGPQGSDRVIGDYTNLVPAHSGQSSGVTENLSSVLTSKLWYRYLSAWRSPPFNLRRSICDRTSPKSASLRNSVCPLYPKVIKKMIGCRQSMCCNVQVNTATN